MTAYEEIKIILNKLPRHLVVSFAIYCAEDCFELVQDKDKAIVRKCIDTTKAYMLGQVTLAELNTAASASYAAASASYAAVSDSYASYAAVFDSYTSYAANAASSASSAAYAAASYAAASYASAASYAAASYASSASASAAAASSASSFGSFYKAEEDKLNEYLTYLKTMLNNLSNLERLIYDL